MQSQNAGKAEVAYQDNDLLAYLNGTAPDELARAIETDMAADQTLEDRLMALDPMLAPVRNAFSHVTTPNPSEFVPSRSGAARNMPWRAAALVAAGVCAGVLGFAMFEGKAAPPAWQDQVASYQALYAADTVAGPQRSEEERRTQTIRAGQRIGHADLARAMKASTELTHVRTQILQVDGVPLAQIVFRTTDGLPVALCGLALPGGQTLEGMVLTDMENLASASFQTQNHAWLLIGTTDPDLIATSAARFKDALQDL